jgi:hypothetical protein
VDTTLGERLDSIEWARYDTAYGPADKVPGQLLRLAGGGPEAMRASHDLWCGLCHQHAYVSSAALPAPPFIAEALDRADEALTVEILDILLGFATCTRPEVAQGAPLWVGELRDRVGVLLPRLRELAGHPNGDIADFAQLIIEDLSGGERKAT